VNTQIEPKIDVHSESSAQCCGIPSQSKEGIARSLLKKRDPRKEYDEKPGRMEIPLLHQNVVPHSLAVPEAMFCVWMLASAGKVFRFSIRKEV
jgi:hypothetical protein